VVITLNVYYATGFDAGAIEYGWLRKDDVPKRKP
jgi:hypothetical protein